ncbi:MAG: hypothetical protein PXX77_09545 [Gallionella sp.]|nr:hypothetical protein [Gallionella sp.]
MQLAKHHVIPAQAGIQLIKNKLVQQEQNQTAYWIETLDSGLRRNDGSAGKWR